MRIKDKKEKINYSDTKNFFKRRAHKYNSQNPYSVTMYQDNNAELVSKRNHYETQKLIRLLDINNNNNILDLACGIGRWADALGYNLNSYVGIDFSEELIKIAKERNTNPKVSFRVGSVTELNSMFYDKCLFDRVLIVGILVYLNDEDIYNTLIMTEHLCKPEARICIREPIGIDSRLTLKDYYSNELDDNYNAIYRTRDELIQLMVPTLLDKGFSIEEEGFLFDDKTLNNRKETTQYYFVLKR